MNIYDFTAENLRELTNQAVLADIINSVPFWVKEYAEELAKNGKSHYEYNFPIEKCKWAAPLLNYNVEQIQYICNGFIDQLITRGFKNVEVKHITDDSQSRRYIKIAFDW